MAWLDPPECNAARHCLEQGNAAKAARILIASKYPLHRAVLRLRLETGQRLVANAGELFRGGHLEAAEESIRLAAECMALDGPALVLQKQIAEALERKRQRTEQVAASLARAKQLVAARRLHTALDILAPLADEPPAAALQDDIRQSLARFARHVGQCQEALRAGRSEAAYRHWERAREILPHSPEVAELASAIARSQTSAGSCAAAPAAVRDRGQRLVVGGLALVVSTGEVCLGSPRGEGVHVPLYGPLHSRHAVLLRDRQGWQLAVCRDSNGRPCRASVDGRAVDSTCRLADGSVFDLGSPACCWRFRIPVAGSRTAVLVPSGGSCPVVFCGGQLECVVLMDDLLLVRAHHPAHLVLPHLPCTQLLFYWEGGRLRWSVEGGRGRLEIPGRTLDHSDHQVYLPSRLHIEPQLDEAELLGRAAAGCEPDQRFVLELTDFSTPERR